MTVSSRALRLIDVALAAWVVAWIGLGVAIGINLDRLTALSRTAATDGHAVQTVGGALKILGAVPLVGSGLGALAGQVQNAGASVAASATTTASSIHVLSVLLAVAIALLPSIPVFGFYLPLRIRRARAERALRWMAQTRVGDPEFEKFLAERGLASLSYDQLSGIRPREWSDLDANDRAWLAAAELRRLGVSSRLLHEPGPEQ